MGAHNKKKPKKKEGSKSGNPYGKGGSREKKKPKK